MWQWSRRAASWSAALAVLLLGLPAVEANEPVPPEGMVFVPGGEVELEVFTRCARG